MIDKAVQKTQIPSKPAACSLLNYKRPQKNSHKSLPCISVRPNFYFNMREKWFPRSHFARSVVWIATNTQTHFRVTNYECRQQKGTATLHYSEWATKNEVMTCCSSPDKVWQMQISSLNPFDYVWCCTANLVWLFYNTVKKISNTHPRFKGWLKCIALVFLLAPKSTEEWQCNNVI